MIIKKRATCSGKESLVLPEDGTIEITLEIEKGSSEFKIISNNTNPQSVSLNVIHKKPNTESKITLNSIVKSKIKVDAKLTMDRDSGGSKGSISMNAIKIGKNAAADFSPKLVVLNSGARAEHRSSTQEIPKEVIAYLMSRGIGKDESERLFCEMFLGQ